MNSSTAMRAFAVMLGSFQLAAGTACQTDEKLLEGIADARVTPMLRDLPHQHGGMNVPAKDGRFLYDLVKEKGYRRGLEIGTSNGYSALWLGLAFRDNGGTLVTLEIDPQSAEEARENFRRAGLDQVIDCRINDAFDEIPQLEGDFDFVFIDAWKPDYKGYLDLVLPRVSPGGAITAHNVTHQRSQMRDFLDAIESHPALETTIHRISMAGISVSFVDDRGASPESEHCE